MENHLKFSQYQNQTLRQSTPSFRATEALQIPNYNQPNSDSFVQSQPDYSQVELPAIYQNTSQIEAPKTFVEKLKKVDLFGGVYPWFENPLLMGGTCFALAKGLDKYTEKCGGEYEKSILGKATKFGDNLENSKFVQSKPVQSVLGWIKTGANKVNKLLNRSSLITAIRTTPARPEKSMPKSELISQEVRILHDFNDIASKLKLGENGVPALKHLGLDKAERNYLKEVFGENYKKVATEKTSNTILLKRLGFDKSKIFVGGMSAGAYLAAITVMNPKFLSAYGLHYKNIAGLVILSGQMTKHFKIKEEMGDTRGQFVPNFDEYAPMANLAADLPPMLLVTGQSGLDMPARPEENSFVAASLKSMGHPFVRCFNLQGHHHGMVLEGSNELIRQFLPAVLRNKPEECFE